VPASAPVTARMGISPDWQVAECGGTSACAEPRNFR